MSEDRPDLTFETLECYRSALKLFSAAYQLASNLPTQERFNLADQLRRAALSILLNIAEGYGRFHYLDKLRFFYIARGSLCETLSAFIAAQQAGYVDNQQMAWVRNTVTDTEKSLNGYITFIRKKQQGSSEFGNRYVHDESSEYFVDADLSDELIPELNPFSNQSNPESAANTFVDKP